MENVSSGSEYRKGKRQVVTLPSGFKFLIKKPSGKNLTKLLNVFEGELTDMSQEHIKELLKNMGTEQITEFIDTIMTNCVLRPKIVDHETDNDNEVWIEDIDAEDYVKIFEAVMKFSGVTEGGLDEASFPGKGNDRTPNRIDSTPGGPETKQDTS